MPTHHLLLPFLGVALIAAPVLAQTGQTTPTSPQSSVGRWITQLQPDQWRASDLEGLDVYSSVSIRRGTPCDSVSDRADCRYGHPY